MRLSLSKNATAWLGQFRADDQSDAAALLDSMVCVSHQKLIDGLRECILDQARKTAKPIGLYAEREIRKHCGQPNRLFKEEKRKVRRAIGSGPSPVQPTRAYDPQVGSEGLIASLITELCREYRKRFINHPGPDKIRSHRIGSFVLVTDFIGTGSRVWNYLQAAWRVWSVRSWHSWHLMHFEVVAYSATELGRKRVRAHPCRPRVDLVLPCPTIRTVFAEGMAKRIRDLCGKYNPIRGQEEDPLGYGGIGALIAFAHGVPNNVPALLFREGKVNGKPWLPLFPLRITAGVRSDFADDLDKDEIAKRLERMRQVRLSRAPWLLEATTAGGKLLLLLASLGRGQRFDEALARRTGLTVPEVKDLIRKASRYGWVNQDRRLTDAGQAQIKQLKRRPRPAPEDLQEPLEPYYPRALRVPGDSPS